MLVYTVWYTLYFVFCLVWKNKTLLKPIFKLICILFLKYQLTQKKE